MLGGDIRLENPIGKLLAQAMDDKENSESVKVDSCGTDGLVVEDSSGLVDILKSNSNFVKADVSTLSSSETKNEACQGVIISDKVQVESGGKLGSVSCSIEERLEKVSLVGGGDTLVVDGSDMKEMSFNVVTGDVESISESESESESETSSSSTSSASSESEDDEVMV